MKINDKLPGGQDINLSSKKVAKSEAKDKVPEREKTGLTDKVEISHKAKELLAAINQLPEIRDDKVKVIKEAIESGNYNVAPLKVAEKILGEL